MVAAAGLLAAGQASAQETLTSQDRAEIQELSARYAKALGGCAAEAYAEVFAPETGYFASNIRGEVVGRERLMALVHSERHCIGTTPNAAAPGAGAARPTPTVAIESSSKGVTGRADLGNAGYYDDEYVKTPTGWRIKSRTVITRQERDANLTVQDVFAIRRLAGTRSWAVRRRVRGGCRWGQALPDIRCRAWSLVGGCDRTGAAEERRRSL